MNHLLGNPELNVTDVNDVHKGLNYIVVDSVQSVSYTHLTLPTSDLV